MQGLSEQDLLHVWESGATQHPLDRALTMLEPAYSSASRNMLAQLSIGQRDTCLFAVRELTFGSHLNGIATCPACQEHIEFSLNLHDMAFLGEAQSLQTLFQKLDQRIYTFTLDSYEVQFHIPTSLDIATIVKQRGDATTLLRRCITQVTQNGTTVSPTELSSTAIYALTAYMAECDPQAEVELALTCAVCQHNWFLLFDIVSYFWAEIAATAKRLLRDVHTLARAYGWREADILAMSTTRRRLYLEMISQ